MLVDKQSLLNKISSQISSCQKCPLYQTATNHVPGEGSPETELFFVGEAPGYYEDQQGRPFVGQAGKLLEELLRSIGQTREEVFISNVLHHRPPGNRDPLPNEVEVCKEYVLKQLEVIKPKVLVTLGRFALNVFWPMGKISRDHGKMRRIEGHDFILFSLYHPAAALRSNAVMQELEADFKTLGKLLKLEKGEITTHLTTENDRVNKTSQIGLPL